MSQTRGYFVTATDTGTGKTFVTCALASLLRSCGRVGVMKPFASGSRGDARRLIRFSGRTDLPLDFVNPIFFDLPLSPFSATQFDRKKIDFRKIKIASDWMTQHSDIVLVEGMGGLHVPITRNFFLADLALQMELPLLIVTHPWLGTLNQTLLTLDYARRKGLKIAGIIFNETKLKKDVSQKTNIEALSRLVRIPFVAKVPYCRGHFAKKIDQVLRGGWLEDARAWL